MKNVTVKFGKYNGQPISKVPFDYLVWGVKNITNQKTVGEFINELATRDIEKFEDCIQLSRKGFVPHGVYRFEGSRLMNGQTFWVVYVMKPSHKNPLYVPALFDAEGRFVRTLALLHSAHVGGFPGAIDTTQTDWVTLDAMGRKSTGRMLCAPYYIHFPHETYQVPQKPTMQDILNKAYNAGFKDYYSGLESVYNVDRAGLQKSIVTNETTGDVVDVWEDGHFEVYNQWGHQPKFTVSA